MQFPESWLREFCNPPLSTAELAELLTMSGMEVEELRPVAPPFHGVVVARVIEVAPHPGADRLRVCSVDAGDAGAPLSIVCGAPNVEAGMKVPCALVGAELPPAAGGGEPLRIGVGRLRGVESRGMLCSARELGLSDDQGGLLVLPADAVVGSDVREALGLDDTLFTLKLTPNLGHVLSVHGVAREVAALTGAPLRGPATTPCPTRGMEEVLPVQVEAADLCGRFAGRIVRNLNPRAATPAWMVERLARCGQRPVSALVDISNYVMFESGQPTHIFDLDRIEGGLAVRWARDGETLELLNGETVELDGRVGVIADGRGVESLAGIMGGAATAVSDDTTSVYVEAAFWWPEAVAGRSRRYGFATDAGHRFERGVDPAMAVAQIERISGLIAEICGTGETSFGPITDHHPSMPARAPVTLRVQRAAKVIGMPLTQAQCAGALSRLGFDISLGDGDTVTVVPPSWRFDLRIEEDLIEEVIRLVGYGSLPATPPVAPVTPRVRSESRRGAHALRHAMAALDYQETINFSFVEERRELELAGNADPIRLTNPIASHLAVMRSSLLGSLLHVLQHNLARRAPRVRVFEIGRVFLREAAAPAGDASVAGLRQPLRLAGLAHGSAWPAQWGARERPVDFHDVKGDVERLLAPRVARYVAGTHPALHPGRCARIEIDGADGAAHLLGHVGELHPRWRQAYELPAGAVLFELDLDLLLDRDVPAAAPVPRQQPVWRDLALIVGEHVTHDALIDAVGPGEGLVRSASLFDVYRPAAPTADMAAGERSLAVRLELQRGDEALVDELIDSEVARVVERVRSRLGARLRG